MTRKNLTGRRLARAALFASARGAGAAVGSATVAVIIWWVQSR